MLLQASATLTWVALVLLQQCAARHNLTAWREKMLLVPPFKCMAKCLRPPPTVPPAFEPVFAATNSSSSRCSKQCTPDELALHKESCTVKLATGCYVFKTTKVTRTGAVDACKTFGMSLLSLDTTRETNLVVAHILKNKANRNVTQWSYLTSARDTTKKNDFRWDGSGAPAVRTEDWLPGEPANTVGTKMEVQCVAMQRVNKAPAGQNRVGLAVLQCSLQYLAICEKY